MIISGILIIPHTINIICHLDIQCIKHIVYTWLVESEQHPEAETSDLYIINADGTGKTQITNTPSEAEHDPVWSPDGSKIAYHTDNTGKVFVIKVK